jgi:GAF domain-containing protein
MFSGLPGFDERLNQLLADCAHDAGHEVDAYVARAVAAQMIVDRKNLGGPALDELLARLSETDIFAEPAPPRVIADPHRLRALYATGQLDSPTEEAYDRITRAAAHALDVPFAAIALVDVGRRFLKSAVGMSGTSARERVAPLGDTLCEFTVIKNCPLVVEDATNDPVFKSRPSVSGGDVVAYLGIPLGDAEGNAVGSLYVSDVKPRRWGTGHVRTLSDFAHLAEARLFRVA